MDCCENIISFCTGAGGIELGLHRVSDCFRTVCYVEIEAFACANLASKIEENKLDAAPVWTNIKTFPASWFSGKIHGITAGFPCQPFSNAGNKMGTEDPRHLWPYIEKSIDVIRPEWVFLENVPGLISTYTIHHRPKWQKYCQRAAERLGAGHAQRFAAKLARHGGISAFRFIAWRLEQMGYRIEAGLFTAEEVGAPHKRERLFILAYSAGSHADRDARELSGKDEQQASERPQGRTAESGGTGQLAIPNGQQRRSHAGGWDDNPEARSAGEGELADANRIGLPIRKSIAGDITEKQPTIAGTIQLADADGSRASPGGEDRGVGGKQQQTTRYPARPEQEQYAWEEPRTVKSGMGRTVDGFASRVDELRLLGNGVVPQCVELAFRTLWEKMGLKL